jgi:hypothetical protein
LAVAQPPDSRRAQVEGRDYAAGAEAERCPVQQVWRRREQLRGRAPPRRARSPSLGTASGDSCGRDRQDLAAALDHLRKAADQFAVSQLDDESSRARELIDAITD